MALAGLAENLGSMFGPSQMNMDVGDSMFETLGQKPKFGPTAEQMAESMRRAQVNRKVQLKEVCVRTYDLGKAADVEQYQLDMEHILLGVPTRTHVLLSRPPPQFVSDALGPRYIVHMQWAEYTLTEEPVPSVGSAGDKYVPKSNAA